MKYYYLLLLLVIVACNNSKKSNNETSRYFIQGKFILEEGSLIGEDPIEISLSDENNGVNKRVTTTTDSFGNFSFSGELKTSMSGTINFEKSLINPKSVGSYVPLIIENDSVFIEIQIVKTRDESLPEYMINKIDFVEGILNKELISLREEMFEEYGEARYNYGDREKQAENVTNNYPKAQDRLLTFFNKLKKEKVNDIIISNLLFISVNRFSDSPLGKNYINDGTRAQLVNLISEFSPHIKKNKNYKILYNSLTKKMNQREFKDFSLIDKFGDKQLLTSHFRKNENTILYFWWSGCAPCRKFNKSLTVDSLKKMESQGINLISVNFDRTVEAWRSASEKDEITWPDLYSGEKSEMYYEYDIQFFPTKLIFDDNKEYVEYKWSSIEDLLELNSQP